MIFPNSIEKNLLGQTCQNHFEQYPVSAFLVSGVSDN
jgi:hypothetical protein